MSVQEQYTETIRHMQENWTTMIASLTDNVSKAFGTSGTPSTNVDPTVAIDQVFDFWSKALEMQRDAAGQFVGGTVSANEKVRSQMDSSTNAEHGKA